MGRVPDHAATGQAEARSRAAPELTVLHERAVHLPQTDGESVDGVPLGHGGTVPAATDGTVGTVPAATDGAAWADVS